MALQVINTTDTIEQGRVKINSMTADLYSGLVNVEWYGAVGDGIADDSAAIRNAISDAPSGGEVFLPGTYLVSKDGANDYCLNVAQANVRLRGAPGAKIVMANAQNTAVVRLSGQGCSVEGLEIDGNRANQTPATPKAFGVDIHASYCRVVRNFIHHTEWSSVYIQNGFTQITVDHNRIEDTGRFCIRFSGTTLAPVTNSRATHNYLARSAVSMMGLGTGSNVAFEHNYGEDSAEDLVACYNADNRNTSVHGNIAVRMGTAGRGAGRITHIGGKRASVKGNIGHQCARGGVLVACTPNENPAIGDDFVVSGNILTNDTAAGDGVRVVNYSNGTISGNALRNPAQRGIELNNCRDIAMSANVCEGSTSNQGIGFLNSTRITSAGDIVMANAGHGIGVYGTTEVTINGLVSRNNGGEGVRIADEPGTLAASSDVTICGCIIKNNTGWGVQSAGGSNYVAITGCSIRSNTAGQTSLVGANNVNANNL